MFMEKLLPILLSNSMWFSSFCSFFNTSFNYWVLGLPPSSITTLTVMLAALNFVLGASIRRLWALRTQRKSIERDVCAPVVLAHQHVVAPIWVQRDPERINHNHKSRGIGYKPLRSEDEPVHIEGSFCWCWSSREGGVGKPILSENWRRSWLGLWVGFLKTKTSYKNIVLFAQRCDVLAMFWKRHRPSMFLAMFQKR